jgi:hypothetical protein
VVFAETLASVATAASVEATVSAEAAAMAVTDNQS